MGEIVSIQYFSGMNSIKKSLGLVQLITTSLMITFYLFIFSPLILREKWRNEVKKNKIIFNQKLFGNKNFKFIETLNNIMDNIENIG